MTRNWVDFQRFYDFVTTIYTNLQLPVFRKFIKKEAANEVKKLEKAKYTCIFPRISYQNRSSR